LVKCEPNITAPIAAQAIGIESLARTSIGDSRQRERRSRPSVRKKGQEKFHTSRL
jgi:hypothetical protein